MVVPVPVKINAHAVKGRAARSSILPPQSLLF
jgi:hypothetical protein